MRVKGVSNWRSGVQLFRGRFQVYGHPKFGMIITKWPRKRGPAKTQAAAINQNSFAQVVKWAKNPMASEVTEAQRGTFQTGYLIRDAIESQCYGLVSFGYDKAGNLIISQRLGNMQIQTLLDAISTTPGALIVRTAVEWVALDPGDTGDVLTSAGPLQPPAWLPASGGGGSGGLQFCGLNTATSARNQATHGQVFQPLQKLQSIWLSFQLNSVSGASYRLGIAPFDLATSKITAAPVYSSTVTITSGAIGDTVGGDIATAIDPTVSASWAAFVTRLDGAPTTTMSLQFSTTTQQAPMLRTFIGGAVKTLDLANQDPDITTTWTVNALGVYALALAYAPSA